MPHPTRQKVKTSYVRVVRKKKKTRQYDLPSGVYDVQGDLLYMGSPSPDGLSPLAQYIEDNIDSGLPILELVEQFQEYDCGHISIELVVEDRYEKLNLCVECGLVIKVKSSGVT